MLAASKVLTCIEVKTRNGLASKRLESRQSSDFSLRQVALNSASISVSGLTKPLATTA